MESELHRLTAYQLAFVDVFMECGNKAKALVMAGYKGKGKKSTLTSQAAKMYSHPLVNAEINRRRNLLVQKKMVDSEQIIVRLNKMFKGKLMSPY